MKMLITEWYHFPTYASLVVIVVTLDRRGVGVDPGRTPREAGAAGVGRTADT